MSYQTLTADALRAGDVVVNADDKWTVVSSVKGQRAYSDSYCVALTHDNAGYDHACWYKANTTFLVRRAN